jgi:hypothetical protein
MQDGPSWFRRTIPSLPMPVIAASRTGTFKGTGRSILSGLQRASGDNRGAWRAGCQEAHVMPSTLFQEPLFNDDARTLTLLIYDPPGRGVCRYLHKSIDTHEIQTYYSVER